MKTKRTTFQFRFNEVKATQAAAKLISLNGGSMNKMKLIKLLYLIDREALLEWGEPLTGDRCYSMKHGPILSEILNHLDSRIPKENSFWSRHISKPFEYDVTVKEQTGEDELSRSELTLIETIFQKFKNFNQYQLRDWCHDNLPEWEDPGLSSIPIEYEEILKAAGKTDTEIEELSEEVESYNRVGRILGHC